MVDSEVRSWMLPTYILFSSYCSVAVLLLESKWDAYLKQFYKAEWHCKLQFNLDLVEWVMGTHSCFMLQPLLALQMYFLVQLYCWNLSIFLRVDAVHWLFVVVSFGFHAVWISERSLILFLKLSLFLVIFVLYNCTLSDSGAHMVQLKCLLWKKKRWRSWLCWLKWSKLPETASSLLTLIWERVMKNDVSMGIVWFFRIAQLPVPEASGVPRVLPVSSAGWQLATLDEESHSCQCH